MYTAPGISTLQCWFPGTDCCPRDSPTPEFGPIASAAMRPSASSDSTTEFQSAHVPFQECQPWAARASSSVDALGTGEHVAQPDRPNFIQLGRMTPDVDELCASHVAAGQGELDTRIDVSIG